jgi:endonuclease/exonuclease/phosphatase family metal-dependent hydrolase
MLTVITFNLRFDNPKDGPHAWPHRREAVGALLRACAPDLIGTQEGLAAQLEELQAELPGYHSFGMGRGNPGQDEYCRVFYRPDRLRLRRQGDFWLSEMPQQAGNITQSWGNSFPRMVTWGEFEPVDGGAPLTFLNTHLDHESAVARERGAEQIARFSRQPEVVHPAIVGGDLNAAPDSRPLQILLGEVPVDGAAAEEIGVAQWARGARSGEPTFHGFTGHGNERIDYLLAEPPVRAARFEVFNQPVDGHWTSDHFPVLAALEW